MRVSTKRILSIGLAGIFLIVAFVVYAQFTSVYLDEISTLRATLLSKQTLHANQSSAVKQVQNATAQFQNFQDVQAKINLAIPNGIQTIQALRQVEAIAARSGSTVTAISFKPVASRASREAFLKKISVLEVSLAATGGYQNLRQFTSLLETNARIANVGSLAYKPGTRTDGDTLSLKIEMYYQDQ